MNDKVKVYDADNNLMEVHAVDAVEIVRMGGRYVPEAPKPSDGNFQSQIDQIKANQQDVTKLDSVKNLLTGYDDKIADLDRRTSNAMGRANSAMSRANTADGKADTTNTDLGLGDAPDFATFFRNRVEGDV